MGETRLFFRFLDTDYTRKDYDEAPKPPQAEVVKLFELIGLTGIVGFPVLEALKLAGCLTENVRLKFVVWFLIEAIRQGSDIAPAAAVVNEKEQIFDPEVLAMISQGESTGEIFEAFLVLARMKSAAPVALTFGWDKESSAAYRFLRALGMGMRASDSPGHSWETPVSRLLRDSAETVGEGTKELVDVFLLTHPQGTPLIELFTRNGAFFGGDFVLVAAAVAEVGAVPSFLAALGD